MEELGARAIDPEGFEDEGPFDVVLELVGASNLAGNLASLATGGRIAVIGVGGTGPKAEINLLMVMQKRARIHGSTLRARPLEEKAAAMRLVEKEVLPNFESGTLRVPVAETFELDRAEEAYDRFELRREAREDRPAARSSRTAQLLPRHPKDLPETFMPVRPQETSPLNVVIVDDHVALRRGMELLLRRAGHHVIGTADDAEAAEALILRRKPDVALVDLALPGMSGAELTRSLLSADPRLRILLYTGAADEAELLEGLDAGAAGFALKSGDPEELEQAILTVAGGRATTSTRGSRRCSPRPETDACRSLSPREREILGLLSQGLSGEEAAKQLVLSSETVRTHVRNAMSKLGAATRAHAVALALQRGEISP